MKDRGTRSTNRTSLFFEMKSIHNNLTKADGFCGLHSLNQLEQSFFRKLAGETDDNKSVFKDNLNMSSAEGVAKGKSICEKVTVLEGTPKETV